MKSDDGNNVVHFATGLPNYHEVGGAKICGRNEKLVGLLTEVFSETTNCCPYCNGEGCKACCDAA